MALDMQEKLATRYYKKFFDEMSENMFLAMTEACHPLIDDIEKCICMAHGVSWDEYLNGDTLDEDMIREQAHDHATQIMQKMLDRFAKDW